MADPLGFFTAGQEMGKAKRSPLSRTTSSIMDTFDKEIENDMAMRKLMAVEGYKHKLKNEGPIGALDQSRIDLNTARKEKLENPEENMSPGMIIQKNKATENLFNLYEDTKLKKAKISSVKDSLKRLPQGLAAKIQTGWMKNFDPNNPIMKDWQSVKDILMDAQLQKVGKTKGAISDREMDSFATAVANDDLISVARMSHVLDAMQNAAESGLGAAMGSYQQNYREDPRKFLETNPLLMAAQGGQQPPVNGTPNLTPEQLAAEKKEAAEALAQNPGSRNAILALYKETTGLDYE